MADIAWQGGELLFRWDDALPLGATLQVAPQQTAVLVAAGVVAAVVGPGSTELSPEALPGLADSTQGDDITAELWFASASALPQKFGTRLKVRDAASGVVAQVSAFGTARVQVVDPERAVVACAESGPEALGQAAQAALLKALEAVLHQAPLAMLVSGAPPELIDALAGQASAALAEAGTQVVGLADLSLSLDPESVKALQAAQHQARPAAPSPAQAPGRCAKCGQALAPGSRFCTGCGAPAVAAGPKVCAQCGTEFVAGAKFCANCGKPS